MLNYSKVLDFNSVISQTLLGNDRVITSVHFEDIVVI